MLLKNPFFLSCVLALFGFSVSLAQSNNQEFNESRFHRLLLHEINVFRTQNGVDSLELDETVLSRTAAFGSEEMSVTEKADAKTEATTLVKRLKKSGGTPKGEELVFSYTIGKNNNAALEKEIVKAFMAKFSMDKKGKLVLLNPVEVYVGIASKPDEMNKKMYLSCVFGSFQSFNGGVQFRKELAVPYNKRSKRLKEPDQKKCKNCEKFKDANRLQQGLYVENGKVYLKYDNLKLLSRLLKKPKDAIAVDIVQKEQYEHAYANIMDNNLKNKGYMLKPMNKAKLLKKNKAQPENNGKKKQKLNSLLVEMGKFPEKITGDYELNLILIQDGYACKTIMRSYVEEGTQDSNTSLELLPVQESVSARKPAFEPRSETAILNFKIPFEKNKFDFKEEDVKPFLDALDEPDFLIDGLFIYAYSSIEGDSVKNASLQRKRAESIVGVLQKRQNNKINPTIITSDSWPMFQKEMGGGKYDYLAKMSKTEAITTLNKNKNLLEELEGSLSKERFAQIVMDVTYDISGDKEQKFTTIQFNRALKSGNYKQAYKIMDYINNKTFTGAYPESIWEKLEIPTEPKNVGLLMSKLHYEYLTNGHVITDELYEGISKLQALDPNHPVIGFNHIYARLQNDTSLNDKQTIAEVQGKIDNLYKTDVPKKMVDGLNIELQFKTIEMLDTMEDAEADIESCITKIKSFYDVKEGSWQNALKLAYTFSKYKEYAYAAKLLEPFVLQAKVNEKLLFAYISIASHVPEKFFSTTFSDALEKARLMNQDRYCKLFGAPFMSFQVLDNPKIKASYREAKCPQEGGN